MNQFYELVNQIYLNPLQSLFLIASVILLEVILSVDNAAVLATMVKDLPEKTQKKALSYGIIGAYVFRGLALVFTSFIIDIWWLKPIGGIYLIWMTYSYFKGKSTETTEDDISKPADQSLVYKYTVGLLGSFWATVVAVEMLDIVFSIDNIFAVIAMSKNYVLIIFGVFVGILAMRFVAQKFVKLMEKFPAMEKSAFIVIGILGIKLFSSILSHFYSNFKWIDSEQFDLVISGITLVVFFAPIVIRSIFPSKK